MVRKGQVPPLSAEPSTCCVLWDDIGDGDYRDGVGGAGVGNGVRKHLTSSYLVAVDGVTLTVQNVLLG